MSIIFQSLVLIAIHTKGVIWFGYGRNIHHVVELVITGVNDILRFQFRLYPILATEVLSNFTFCIVSGIVHLDVAQNHRGAHRVIVQFGTFDGQEVYSKASQSFVLS